MQLYDGLKQTSSMISCKGGNTPPTAVELWYSRSAGECIHSHVIWCEKRHWQGFLAKRQESLVQPIFKSQILATFSSTSACEQKPDIPLFQFKKWLKEDWMGRYLLLLWASSTLEDPWVTMFSKSFYVLWYPPSQACILAIASSITASSVWRTVLCWSSAINL